MKVIVADTAADAAGTVDTARYCCCKEMPQCLRLAATLEKIAHFLRVFSRAHMYFNVQNKYFGHNIVNLIYVKLGKIYYFHTRFDVIIRIRTIKDRFESCKEMEKTDSHFWKGVHFVLSEPFTPSRVSIAFHKLALKFDIFIVEASVNNQTIQNKNKVKRCKRMRCCASTILILRGLIDEYLPHVCVSRQRYCYFIYVIIRYSH